MTNKFFTIGYEGSSIEAFTSTLLAAGISRLIDVRELPLSRKKGFSKNILASHLSEIGIEYVHLKGLGDPKPGRDAARAGDFKKFETIFAAHMNSSVAQADLTTAAKLITSRSSALLCFERDCRYCHRSIVAKHLIDITGMTVNNIGVQPTEVLRNAQRATTNYECSPTL